MKKLIVSFNVAVEGFLVAMKEQRNLRIHVAIAFLILVLAYVLKVSTIEFVILLLCVGLVIGLELVNSAIESLVDLVSPERKPLAGKTKDIAAAAVLFAAIVAALVGLIIFGKHLLLQ